MARSLVPCSVAWQDGGYWRQKETMSSVPGTRVRDGLPWASKATLDSQHGAFFLVGTKTILPACFYRLSLHAPKHNRVSKKREDHTKVKIAGNKLLCTPNSSLRLSPPETPLSFFVCSGSELRGQIS